MSFIIPPSAKRLSQAVRYATVSHQDPAKVDWSAFSGFIAFLEQAYPLLHQRLTKTLVNDYGLIYHWQGKNQERRVLLTAHYDVVPAQDEGWPYPPFSGQIAQERIYGRGSFDDKSSLIALLEAVSLLLEDGFIPPQDIYLAFGFDEEVGGNLGAKPMAQWFLDKGITFDHVLDEGGAVADGAMMGIDKPVAVIGVAEKGNTSFELTFEGQGGHSSTPPKDTAVSLMARFIAAVQAKPQKPRLTSVVKAMLQAAAPHKKGIQSYVLSRPDLFAPIIISTMLKGRQTAAMLRTTAAFTQAKGGSAHNVLPESASCTVNLRLLQGDSVEAAMNRFRSLGIPFTAKPILTDEPSQVSDLDSAAMAHLSSCIAVAFPEAVITPYLMTGGTDCRHYEKVTRNAYRFQPARVNEQELSLMHSRGEYLSIQNLEGMIAFYALYLRTLPE